MDLRRLSLRSQTMSTKSLVRRQKSKGQPKMILKQLEETVAHLPPDELARFPEWFIEFDAKRWDTKIEIDTTDGLLDRLADNAITDHRD